MPKSTIKKTREVAVFLVGSIAATECNKHYVFGGSIQYDLVINSTVQAQVKPTKKTRVSMEKKIRFLKTYLEVFFAFGRLQVSTQSKVQKVQILVFSLKTAFFSQYLCEY